jgi:hypothetical protein
MPKQYEIDEAGVQDTLRELELHPDIPVRTAANKHGAKYKRVLTRRKGRAEQGTEAWEQPKAQCIGTATLLSQVHDAATHSIALHTPPG